AKTPQVAFDKLETQTDRLSREARQAGVLLPPHGVGHGVTGEGVTIVRGKACNRLASIVEDGDAQRAPLVAPEVHTQLLALDEERRGGEAAFVGAVERDKTILAPAGRPHAGRRALFCVGSRRLGIENPDLLPYLKRLVVGGKDRDQFGGALRDQGLAVR